MYVCICNAVTESQIRQAVDEGITSLKALKSRLGVASNCGCCAEQAAAVLQKRLLEIASAAQKSTHSSAYRPHAG